MKESFKVITTSRKKYQILIFQDPNLEKNWLSCTTETIFNSSLTFQFQIDLSEQKFDLSWSIKFSDASIQESDCQNASNIFEHLFDIMDLKLASMKTSDFLQNVFKWKRKKGSFMNIDSLLSQRLNFKSRELLKKEFNKVIIFQNSLN
jgi:hypothetical protein